MAYGTVNADVIGTSVAGSNLGAGNASIMKNRIINGAMVINQRATAITATGYSVDRFAYFGSQASKVTISQDTSVYPTGFNASLKVLSSSAYTVGSTEEFEIYQSIEGFNTADLMFGTANAQTVTLSFWVYSSLTGTFGGALQNSAGNRSYPFTYTISSANTWTSVSVTIAGDTTGTWVGATNGIGLVVYFGLGVGSTKSGTAGAWAGAYYTSATGATSVVGTNGATFYITGVQLEVGSSATGFEYVNYQTSLANCQRYFEIFTGNSNVTSLLSSTIVAGSANPSYLNIYYKQTKRATPTVAARVGWVNVTPSIYPAIDNCACTAANYFYLDATGTVLTVSAEL
jgi:hypothetical protein